MSFYQLVQTDVMTTAAVVIDGELYVTDNLSNPRFSEIEDYLRRNEVPPVYLFDLTVAVADRFENLSERVSVAGGHVYFDGDELDSSLTQQIMRFVEDDVEDWQPLVRFLENLQQNPSENSREQLYDWLRGRNFTITEDGSFLAYKGVYNNGDEEYKSIHAGTAVVDGVRYENQQIPQRVGSVVTMPRSEVADDPNAACSVGLHVGTFDFASSFAPSGALLTIKINPRDVVSVPHDARSQKVRVCRYEVVASNEIEHDEPIWNYGPELDDDNLNVVTLTSSSTWTAPNTTTTTTINSQAKLHPDDVREIRSRHKLGYSVKTLSEDYDVSERSIQRIVSGQAWSWVR